MKKILLIVIIAAFGFGCKKDNGGSGGSGNTSTYLPLTAGTNWTYKVTNNGTISTVKLTVQSGDFLMAGKNYKRVIDGGNTDTSHYNQTGSDYYRFFKFGGLLGDIELNILKDNLAAGGTWTASKMLTGITIPGIPIPVSATANFAFSIDGKDLTRVINSTSYNSIIKVKLVITATTPVGVQNIGTGEFYFAKNVGIVEYSINTSNPLGGGGTTAEKYEIQSYQIK
jgi:hypothetical protein